MLGLWQDRQDAWMLPDGVAWTKAVYTTEILALLQAAKVM